MAKVKQPSASSLFDAHSGSVSCSRTSNTYSSAGIQGYTYVPETRMQAFQLPSRMGNRLHYPDGTVTETNHARSNHRP